jgi:hypothetical protein
VMDKSILLKPRLPELEVALEGVGTVRIRALSRTEADRLGRFGDKYEDAMVFILSTGLIDPVLTADEVRQWRSGATTEEIETVNNAILDLSGLLDEKKVAAEARQSFPAEQGQAARVPPGPDPGDDRGPAS